MIKPSQKQKDQEVFLYYGGMILTLILAFLLSGCVQTTIPQKKETALMKEKDKLDRMDTDFYNQSFNWTGDRLRKETIKYIVRRNKEVINFDKEEWKAGKRHGFPTFLLLDDKGNVIDLTDHDPDWTKAILITSVEVGTGIAFTIHAMPLTIYETINFLTGMSGGEGKEGKPFYKYNYEEKEFPGYIGINEVHTANLPYKIGKKGNLVFDYPIYMTEEGYPVFGDIWEPFFDEPNGMFNQQTLLEDGVRHCVDRGGEDKDCLKNVKIIEGLR